MTSPLLTEENSISANGSWADDLPPAFEAEAPNPDFVDAPESTDQSGLINPPENACRVCGNEIFRRPGQRGRLAKVHPECKGAQAVDNKRASVPRITRASKQDVEKETEIVSVLTNLGSKLNRAIILLSIVDPYDALVIKINADEIISNMRALLWKYDKFRAFAVGAETGASVFSLIVAVLTTVLPIMAHHNLIPSKKVSQFMLQAPFVLLRIHQMREQSESGDFTLELLQRAKHQAEQSRRAANQRQDNGDADTATA